VVTQLGKRIKIMAFHDMAAFEMALADATFISIDGYMFRVTAWYPEDSELHFKDEETGDMHVNTFEDLVEDMGEIEIFTLTKSWAPEMLNAVS
jgi:hypothetical protein